jgi:Protein of unknown function (DUF1403)
MPHLLSRRSSPLRTARMAIRSVRPRKRRPPSRNSIPPPNSWGSGWRILFSPAGFAGRSLFRSSRRRSPIPRSVARRTPVRAGRTTRAGKKLSLSLTLDPRRPRSIWPATSGAVPKLLSQRARLRARGTGKVVDTLLQDDALAPAARIGGMSDRAMRRIVDRLVALGVARELTARPTFRLYGL